MRYKFPTDPTLFDGLELDRHQPMGGNYYPKRDLPPLSRPPKVEAPIESVSRKLSDASRSALFEKLTGSMFDLGSMAELSDSPRLTMMSVRYGEWMYESHYRDDPLRFNAAARRAISAANSRARGLPLVVVGVDTYGLRRGADEATYVGLAVESPARGLLKSQERAFLRQLLPLDDVEQEMNSEPHVSVARAYSLEAAELLVERFQNLGLVGMQLQTNSARPVFTEDAVVAR